MTQSEYSAFISHSSKDIDAASEIAASLERSGLTCWIAPRDVKPGATWADEIIRGINSSRCFILLISSAANLSDNVLREVERAASKSKPIYPVRIEDVAPADRLEYFVSMHHWIDALDGLVAAQVERLVKAMEGGDGWTARPETSTQKVENPFGVMLTYRGPILPAPRRTESWKSLINAEAKKTLGKAKLGEDGREWSVPKTLSWLDDETLYYGGSQSIYRVDVSRQSVELAFSVPRWRERCILDFACRTLTGDTFIFGNTFRRTMIWRSENFRYASDLEDHISPDWGRVVPHPEHSLVLETGLVRGRRSENIFKRFFAIPDGDGSIYQFTVSDPRKNEGVATWNVNKFLNNIYTVRWSPTGKFLGLCGYDVMILPVETHLEAIDGHDLLPNVSPNRRISQLAWHPTRDIYVTSWNCWTDKKPDAFGFYVTDAADGNVLHEQTLDRRAETTALDWSPDGRFLALGGADEAIFLWDFERDRGEVLLGHSDWIRQVHFSPDGQRLLSSDGKTTKLWDPLAPSEPIQSAEIHLASSNTHRINGSPWSPDGRKFAGFGRPGGVEIIGLS